MNPNNFYLLSQQGFLAVSGKDAEKFLQGQLTCDLREITHEQSRFAAYCTAKGRVIATFRLFRYQDIFYLQMPKTMVEIVLAQLRKYAVFSKVTTEDVSQQFKTIGCIGSNAIEFLQKLFPKIPETVDAMSIANELILIRIPGEDLHYNIIASANIIDSLQKNLPLSADKEIWRLYDILAGIPHIYPKTSEMFTAHMINLPQLNGISFNKGCYVGQEIIARTHYLGKSKRSMHLATLNTEQIPQPGNKLTNQKKTEVGNIVDAAKEDNNFRILAVIQEDALSDEIYWNENLVQIK